MTDFTCENLNYSKVSFEKRKRGAPERSSKWSRALPIPKFKDTFIPMSGEEGRGLGRCRQTFFDPESKSDKILNSLCLGGGGGEGRSTFQLLILSPNLLKSQNSLSLVGGGGG